MLLGGGELPSARDKPTYWLSNVEWSALKPYTHHQQKQTQQVVLMSIRAYTCIHIFIYQVIVIKVKEAANWGVGGDLGLEGRKVSKVILFQLQTLKNKKDM